ncbi:hypothetical protein ON010_g18340 [Phytophthora cinnamomi]|nr:hypothetical protein ON010_g18340 [Phytophthora cinnamomi]
MQLLVRVYGYNELRYLSSNRLRRAIDGKQALPVPTFHVAFVNATPTVAPELPVRSLGVCEFWDEIHGHVVVCFRIVHKNSVGDTIVSQTEMAPHNRQLAIWIVAEYDTLRP